ncbi:MAG: hypothetical protein HXY25_07615 [Alphaproteobacteria bacterium]|nr:hypothetical protein [Alphaproteobacteria bacterium]
MIRMLIPVAFATLPFIAYFLFLLAQNKGPYIDHVRRRWVSLGIAGLILAILSIAVIGFRAAPRAPENGPSTDYEDGRGVHAPRPADQGRTP